MNFKNTLFIGIATLLTTTGAFAQVKKKPATAAHKTTSAAANQQTKAGPAGLLAFDPEVVTGKLPNGLTYYIRKNTAQKGQASLLLVNKVGSVYETDAQQGLANFIQNMAFKGTRDYPKKELAGFLTKTGMSFGPDTNAFVTYDESIYQLSVRTDTDKMLDKGLSVLANWSSYMTFNPADVASTKAVVAQQATQTGKTAQERLQAETLPVLLNNSKYAQRPPLGKEAIIKGFTDASVKGFYTDWYRPDLQAIVAVGDFDTQAVLDAIKFNFSSLRNPAAEKPAPVYTIPASPGTTVKIATDKDFQYTLAQVLVRHPQANLKTPADFMQSVRIGLFNQMLADRFTELTQKPASPVSFARASYGPYAGNQDAFTAVVVAGATGLEPALKAMTAELQRINKFGFTSTELERAKQNALDQIGNAYKQKDFASSAGFAGSYERSFISGQVVPGLDYEYNYYINNIGKITLADIGALANQLISDQNRVVLIEAPDKEKSKLPNEQTVLKWMGEAGQGLTAYVDDNANPLMTTAPVAGKVVSSVKDSVIYTQTVTLSNGVKVILKPTEFNNNQILFAGYSFGGTSLASNADFASASLVSNVIGNSGVSNFNQEQLNKMLRGKNIGVTSYISDATQGVSGYATPQDFESAMQLIYLYFTSPRKDADVWKTNLNQAKSLIAKKTTDPGSIYQDTVLAVLGGYNPRVMPTTAAQLDAASLDKGYDFYKARFADASNFTFTFTGAFSVEAIIPYLETYLGSLPSTNSKETFKDLGIRPLAGQVTKNVYKGTTDKANVQLIFNGAYDYNTTNNIQLDALEEVLNIRLADSIKAESGVSSASVVANYVKIPQSRYKVSIAFVCDAANVEKATANVLAEINKIKQNGAVEKDVRIFATREARSFQAQVKQNTYWEASLTAAAQNQEDPDKLLSYMMYLENVTPQTVKATAVKYLNESNLIKIILLPEKK